MITRKTLIDKVYKRTGGVLTSAYGTPRDGGARKHAGEDWDIAGTESPKVYSPWNGIVTHAQTSMLNDRGREVEIKIGKKYFWFQHLSSCSVTEGQRIAAGKQFGVQGGSGKALGSYKSHMHFEVSNYPMGDPRRIALNPVYGLYLTFIPPKYPTKKVIVSDLHIRQGHSVKGKALGYIDLGPIEIFEQYVQDGYVWGRIDWVLDQWIALRSTDGKKVYAK